MVLLRVGCAEDSRVQLLFEEGLPLRRNGRRGGGKKNADEAPSFTLPAFSVAEVQQGASLPLFDIPAIAKHFSGLLKVQPPSIYIAASSAAEAALPCVHIWRHISIDAYMYMYV